MRHPFKHPGKTKSKEKPSRGSESAKGLLHSKRDGSDDDSKAIDWWRSHKKETDGSNDAVRKSKRWSPRSNIPVSEKEDKHDSNNSEVEVVLPGSALSPPDQYYLEQETVLPPSKHHFVQNIVSSTKDHSEENGDSLETPYDFLHRELPINPENGMVLHPRLLPHAKDEQNGGENPSLGLFVTKGRSDSDDGANRMAIFKPQVIRSPSTQKWEQERQARLFSKKHDTKASPVGTRDQELMTMHGAVANGSLNQTAPNTPSSSALQADEHPNILPLSKFMEGNSKNLPTTTNAAYRLQSSDHLSDGPSDVDSITRERYRLACQMLKATIVRKESSLMLIEKEYILGLLEDFEARAGDESVITEDQVSAVEYAILQLEEKGTDLPSPATAAVRPQTNTNNTTRDPTEQRRSDKNPHTATRKPIKSLFMERLSNPCKPIRFGKGNGEKESYSSDEEGEIQLRKGTFFERMEVNSAYDDNDDDDNQGGDHSVRFDGWSFPISREYPFAILGTNNVNDMEPRVFTPGMMEGLRGFMPLQLYDQNFWLRFSLSRDGGTLDTLLTTIRASPYTMIGVETDHGEVFGCFTGAPWRIGSKWYGNNEAFLWRLKQRRYTSPQNSRKPNFEREIEVYPCTGDDDLIQFCTSKTMAVGGGDWRIDSCPYNHIDQGIGFMIDGDLAGGETNSCGTFANPKLARHTTSSSEFTISNLEVWSLTPCTNLKDATERELLILIKEYGEV